jgi:hypothetical protein
VVVRIEEGLFGVQLEEAGRNVSHDKDSFVVLRVPEFVLQPFELKKVIFY